MNFFKYSVFALILGYQSCIARDVQSNAQILDYVWNSFPFSGVLKISNGFVYVDVDDAYIHKLIGFIEEEGFEEPPYFGRKDLVGAHISIAYAEEIEKYGVDLSQECGKQIGFNPQKCEIVHPPRWEKIDEVCFLVVDAPLLDQIRKKYGLPKKTFPYHITIGVKPKLKSA